jgi:hypothetical protein
MRPKDNWFSVKHFKNRLKLLLSSNKCEAEKHVKCDWKFFAKNIGWTFSL